MREELKNMQEGIKKAIQETIKVMESDFVKSGQHLGDIWKTTKTEDFIITHIPNPDADKTKTND